MFAIYVLMLANAKAILRTGNFLCSSSMEYKIIIQMPRLAGNFTFDHTPRYLKNCIVFDRC